MVDFPILKTSPSLVYRFKQEFEICPRGPDELQSLCPRDPVPIWTNCKKKIDDVFEVMKKIYSKFIS